MLHSSTLKRQIIVPAISIDKRKAKEGPNRKRKGLLDEALWGVRATQPALDRITSPIASPPHASRPQKLSIYFFNSIKVNIFP